MDTPAPNFPVINIIGSHDGYVAEPTDLYKYGINNAGLTEASPNYVKFLSNMIKITSTEGAVLSSTKSYNYTPYKTLTITGHNYNTYISFNFNSFRLILGKVQHIRPNPFDLNINSDFTCVFNISTCNFSEKFTLGFYTPHGEFDIYTIKLA